MRESVLSGAAAEQLCEHEDNEAGLEFAKAVLASAGLEPSSFLACVSWLEWSAHHNYIWQAEVERAYRRRLPAWPKPCRFKAREAMFRLRFMRGDYAEARRLIRRRLPRRPLEFDWQEYFDLALALNDPELIWQVVERIPPVSPRAKEDGGPSEWGSLLAACVAYWRSRADNFLILNACCDAMGKPVEQFALDSRGAGRRARNFDAALSFHRACADAVPEVRRIQKETPPASSPPSPANDFKWCYFERQLYLLIKLLEAGVAQ